MPQQWILTWAQQQWIRITRMLLGVCPPTRRSKRRLRGTLAHWGTPSDWPSTIDASQLDAIDVQAPFEAQGRGFEHAHGKWHGIVGTTPSTIDASQLDTFREPHFICNGLVCMLCGEHQLDWGTPMQTLVCDGCYEKECGGLYCSCYDELEPKPEVQAYKPGSKLNAVPEAGPVKDAPTIDASQLDASRNSDHHALTLLPSRPCPYAHAPDHALALMPISQLTMPGCRWTDVINL